MLLALEDYLQPPQIVLLRGPATSIVPWLTQLNAVFAPRRWTLAIPADARELPAAIADKPAGAGARAYVCQGLQCSAPIDSLAALLKLVSAQPENTAEGPREAADR